MNTLIKKVLEYQRTNEEFLFNDIICELNMLINIQCSKIIKYYEEDLRQELLFEIYKAIPKYIPEKELIKEELEFNKISIIFNNITKSEYYESFKKKYEFDGDLFNLKDIAIMTNVINEFYLFCNENQFRKYINILCDRRRFDFCRKYKVNEDLKKISLNIVDNTGEEYIYKLMDKKDVTNIYDIDYSLLPDNDKKFLELFVHENRRLTEKEVAKLLGISQQAVSSMLKRIKERYRNKLSRSN